MVPIQTAITSYLAQCSSAQGARHRAVTLIETLPSESPKLYATAVFHAGEDLATRLERALARSAKAPKVIEAKPIEP